MVLPLSEMDAIAFLACPDFKGIKTAVLGTVIVARSGFWPALISKGLRPHLLQTSAMARFLACPDFKGIKTPWWNRPA